MMMDDTPRGLSLECQPRNNYSIASQEGWFEAGVPTSFCYEYHLNLYRDILESSLKIGTHLCGSEI